jgi:subtilisin-like proprotein convertase family protein
MMTRHSLRLIAALALLAFAALARPAAAGVSINRDAIEQTRAAFEAQHPEGGLFDLGPRLRRAYGARLATGDTPSNSGTAFFAQWAGMWGVDANDLQPVGPFEDGAHVITIPGAEGSDADFSGVYFTQTAGGVPVFRAFGWALARNEADFPVVLAGGTLRPVGDFAQQVAGRNLDQSTLDPAVYTRHSLAEFGAQPSISTPRYVVWAGIDDDVQEPRLAVEFVASGANPRDPSNPLKIQYVVDAADGTVLYQESKILHAIISGTVSGNATPAASHKADVCETTRPAQRLPFVKVTIGTQVVYADANGAFNSGNNVPSNQIVQPSVAEGKYFQVSNQAGDTITVAPRSVAPGVPAAFTFNDVPSEYTTAQMNAYIHANKVRSFALSVNPNYPVIGTQTVFPLYVNIDDSCNAYYDPTDQSLNFYRTKSGCNNSAFSSVIHHEYGHHLVNVGGSAQGAFGEGFGDVMAVLVNDDPQLGVGFQSCSTALRNAQNTCQYSPSGCSSCGSEIHACGQLLSGIVWDLRQGYIGRFPLNYLTRVGALALNTVPLHAGQSDISGDIQIDYLTLDDNDGNLFNGTPNSDLINAAFALHGFGAARTPTNLTATKGTIGDRVHLTWSALRGYTSFKIFRSSSGVPLAQIGTSTTPFYDDMTAAIGVVYTYQVQAINPIGNSDLSASDTGYISVAVPTGVAASDGTTADGVLVSWTPVASASGYRIYRKEVGVPTATGAGFLIKDFKTLSSGATPSSLPGATVKSITITINDLTHTWMGDTTFRLAHGATTCVLADMCGDARQFTGTYVLDDSAETPFCQQPQVGGTYRPSNSMNTAFAGQSPDGEWTLSVQDQGPGDEGGCSSWSISILNQIGTASGSTFLDTSAIPGKLYSYSISSVVGEAVSPTSASDSGWRRLSPPTGVTASDAAYIDRVIVGWNAVTGATGYQVLRATGDAAPEVIGTSTTTTFTDFTALPETVHRYFVVATCALGNSERSQGDNGSRSSTIAAPTNVVASDGTFTTKVEVSWTPVTGATGYQVFRGDSSTPFVTLIGGSTSSYSDTTADVLIVYSYRVKSVYQSVVSVFSSADTGFRSPVVSAPTNVAASDGAYTDKVVITWNPVAGATFYQVFRSGTAAPIGTVNGYGNTTFNDTAAGYGISYTYQVKAGNAGNASSVSAKDAGFRRVKAPLNVSATKGTLNGRVLITWNGVDGANGYKIYRNGASTAIGSVAPGTVLSFSDYTAQVGSTYVYTVRANSPTGLSEPSAGATGYPGALNMVTGVTASDGTYTEKVRVTWDKLVGATEYKVYRNGALIGSSVGNANNAYNDLTAAPSVVYTYAVRGVMLAGMTEPSAGDTGYRAAGSAGGGAGNNGSGSGSGSQGAGVVAAAGSASSASVAKASGPQTSTGQESNSSSKAGDDGAAALTTDASATDPALRTVEQIACDELIATVTLEMQTSPVLAESLAARLTQDEDGDGVMDVCQRQRGDFDLNGVVDDRDLTSLLLAFETLNPNADINLDGEIDGADIGLLLLMFDDRTRPAIDAAEGGAATMDAHASNPAAAE